MTVQTDTLKNHGAEDERRAREALARMNNDNELAHVLGFELDQVGPPVSRLDAQRAQADAAADAAFDKFFQDVGPRHAVDPSIAHDAK
ncbi:MAG TPA: hypothetical protein VHB51_00135 [Candidatus Saccharimonadales bacterium]|nr:hypothetical protein [Candidatus Saccharimonadales bacterium]